MIRSSAEGARLASSSDILGGEDLDGLWGVGAEVIELVIKDVQFVDRPSFIKSLNVRDGFPDVNE